MTTNEKFFQVNLWGKLHNSHYSLVTLEITFYFIMPATEACKFTLLLTLLTQPSLNLRPSINETSGQLATSQTTVSAQIYLTKSVSQSLHLHFGTYINENLPYCL